MRLVKLMQNDLLVVTGGLGFIGKNFTQFIKDSYKKILVIDKNSEHSDIDFLNDLNQDNITIIESDISDTNKFEHLLPQSFDLVNFAAESHVDRSFVNSIDFSYSNYIATHKLLEFIRLNNLSPRIIHISTDEVYGSIENQAATESSLIKPTNPYSVSKAAADLLCQTYVKCYGLNILIVRPNNIYGPYQHFEKLIPRAVYAAFNKDFMTIHGDGSPKRSFLNVIDFSKAINILLKEDWNNLKHSIFNITSNNEFSVLEIIKMIAEISDTNISDFASFGSDRPFNDLRYLTDCSRLNDIGWVENEDFSDSIAEIFNKQMIFKGKSH